MRNARGGEVILLPLGTVPGSLLNCFPQSVPALPLPTRFVDGDGTLRADALMKDRRWPALRRSGVLPGPKSLPWLATARLPMQRPRRPIILLTTLPLSTRECSRVLGLSSPRRQLAVVSTRGLEGPVVRLEGPAEQPEGPTRRFTAPPPSRLRNLILHELGHLRGLKHCQTPGCLMTPVTRVEELDYRQHLPCRACRKVGGEEIVELHFRRDILCPARREACGMEDVEPDSGPIAVALPSHRRETRP